MKRKDALQKLTKICQRLDGVDPNDFHVIPLRLYLFGSLLTDKENPDDIDLLFQYEERSDLDPNDILYALTYGKPLPYQRAFTFLRNRMKMIRFESMSPTTDVAGWLADHMFLPETPARLVWEPQHDWQDTIAEIANQSLPWDPDLERQNKFMQERLKKIVEDEGVDAAAVWIKEERGKQNRLS